MLKKLSVVFALVAISTGLWAAEAEKKKTKTVDPKSLRQYYNDDGIIHLLEVALKKIKRYRTYTYGFVRCERIGGSLTEEEHIAVKVRHRPFSIYMKWLEDEDLNGSNSGREVLYVDGKNDGKFMVHLGPRDNLLIPFRTVSMAPNDKMVRNKSRHPITKAGMLSLTKGLLHQFKLAKKHGDLKKGNVVVSEDKNLWFLEDEDGKQPIPYAIKIVRQLPKRGDIYYCKKLIMHLDPVTFFPVRIKTYDWDDSVLEIYTYKNVKRASLTSKDFDSKNKGYNF